jgi:predicted RNA-binding Zn-ribbon protein involved in translation (DUF1610 family)
MAAQEQGKEGRTVKRVALPGGRAMEVVYFQQTGREAEHLSRGQQLHVCPACGSELVYPVEWEEAGPTNWQVSLRCPNCEWSETATFEQDTVERFDDELDRGTSALIEDLKRLTYANMEEEIDLFCEALAGNHVLPEDF